MRGLAIGIALAAILFLFTGGHFLLVPLLVPLGFFALLRNRTTWQPVPRTYRPGDRRTGSPERE
jgi:hypothetical protein